MFLGPAQEQFGPFESYKLL